MTSETVQAAQRLLAERERFGLAKYGTTVDRTDLQAGDWLQHAIEEASDLLLYLLRLQQMMPRTPDSDLPTLSGFAGIAPDSLCPCGDRDSSACPGQWEPGCDLGSNEAHAVPAPQEAALALREAMQPTPAVDTEAAERAACFEQFATSEPQPVDFGPFPEHPHPDPVAEGFRRKAEREALLRRWKDAPAYADWLSQDSTGWCCWWQAEPILVVGVRVPYWTEGPGLTGDKIYAGHNILGSVRCEPRPVQGVGR